MKQKKKVCKTAKKRLKKNTRNITDEAKEKLHSSYQKKESRPFMKILMMKQKRNCVKVIKKESKQFVKTLMMKPKRYCMKVIDRESKQFLNILLMNPKRNYVKMQTKEGKQFVKTSRKVEIKLLIRLKIAV